MKKKNIFDRTFFELTGCIHNHTEYSFDSDAKIPKIINSAKKNGLDYLTINDHLTKKAREDSAVINEKELIVIVGVEINDKTNNNHYLVFNSDTIITDKKADEYVRFYKQDGAIGFAAHPFEKRSSKKFRKYLWTDRENDDFDGLEIWNFLSCWLGNLKPKVNGLFLVIFPSLFVRKPYRKIIEYWDELNNSGKRKAAIGSIDAHEETYKIMGIPIKFLTHNTLFHTIRTNVLLSEKEEVNEKYILSALKAGRSYIVNYKIGFPYNFYAGIVSPDKTSAIFGEEIDFQNDLKLFFQLSKTAKVTLFRNGKRSSTKWDNKGFFDIAEKGNYRLEISRFGRGWIYTNNIYVT